MVSSGHTRYRHAPDHSAEFRVALSQSSLHATGFPAIGAVYRRAGLPVSWKFLSLVRCGQNSLVAVVFMVFSKSEGTRFSVETIRQADETR